MDQEEQVSEILKRILYFAPNKNEAYGLEPVE